MKTKVIKATIFSLLVMSYLLVGCGKEEQTIISETSEQENVTVAYSWWGNDDRHKYTMEAIDLFEEANPSIDVKEHYGEWSGYERKNRVWMESINTADVMQINYAWLSEYSEDGD